jgi:hypothetical protein
MRCRSSSRANSSNRSKNSRHRCILLHHANFRRYLVGMIALGDTPLGLKRNCFRPRGFSLWQEDCIPLTLQASYADGGNSIRGRCHHLQLLERSKYPQILLSTLDTSRWAHRTSGLLSGVHAVLVLTSGLTRSCFYPKSFA